MTLLPEVTFQILDGQLGLVGDLAAHNQVKIGVCSDGIPGVIYGFGSTGSLVSTLGQGPVVEAAAQVLTVAGPAIFVLPITPSVSGSASSVTHTGAGAGTVAVSFGPRFAVQLKIVTGGTNGTMTFEVSLNGGAFSSPVTTTSGAFTYAIPGTLTSVTFASGQTWVSADVYTVNPDGSVVLTGSGPAASNVTQASNPLDNYGAEVSIATGGALGVAVFNLSLDGGNTFGASTLVPSGGKYVVPNTGLVLTFASTFVAGDLYAFTTTTAGFSTGDLGTAIQTLVASSLLFETIHVVGAAANAAGAAAVAAVVDAQMTAAEAQFRFASAIVECPTSESDSTVAAAFASFTSKRVGVVAGDVDLVTALASGRIQRRNLAWAFAARIASITPGESAAYVGRGPLANVAKLYRDEAKTPLLDQAGFVTARTYNGETGFFVTRARIMAPTGSDFSRFERRRPMDEACTIVRRAELPYLNGPFRVDNQGHVLGNDAQAFERRVGRLAEDGTRGDVSSISVAVDRTANILSTEALPVEVSIVPLFTAETIANRIGFTNPALVATQ
jgi:hypothetical protein